MTTPTALDIPSPPSEIEILGHNPCSIANEFIKLALEDNDPIDPITLQRLMFFAHGWMLAIHKKPLHYGSWQAWKYGPILPQVYFNLSYFRANPIPAVIQFADVADLSDDARNIIDFVYKDYRPMGYQRLSDMARAKGSPWYKVKWGIFGRLVISNDKIQKYFSKMHQKIEVNRKGDS